MPWIRWNQASTATPVEPERGWRPPFSDDSETSMALRIAPEAGVRGPFIGSDDPTAPDGGWTKPFTGPDRGWGHPFVAPDGGWKPPFSDDTDMAIKNPFAGRA
jgi:hypothetical protein